MTSEQLTLDGRTATEQKLTPRQVFALDLIRELGPIPPDELGAHMHERRGIHSTDIRCRWCPDAGKEIGSTLRGKKVLQVHERRGEGWYVGGRRSAVTRRDGSHDPATSEWPEGF